MTWPTGEHKDRSPEAVQEEDVVFGKRLAKHFAPAPLTRNQRAAFDMALEARIEKLREYTFSVPALATVAGAAVILIFALNGGMSLNPHTSPRGARTPLVAAAPMTKTPLEAETGSADSLARDEWAYDLLAFNKPIPYADESHGLSELDETHEAAKRYASEENGDDNNKDSGTDLFPAEYLAIESVFLEG